MPPLNKNNKMQEDVIKRLVSSDSSTTTLKRTCFRKLHSNDYEVTTIVNLAVDMGATIEQAKGMLINDCIERSQEYISRCT